MSPTQGTGCGRWGPMLGLTLESKKFKIDWVLAGQWERLSGGLVVKGLCPCVDSDHIPVDQLLRAQLSCLNDGPAAPTAHGRPDGDLGSMYQIPGKTAVVTLGTADPWGDVATYIGGHVSIPQFLPMVQLCYIRLCSLFWAPLWDIGASAAHGH